MKQTTKTEIENSQKNIKSGCLGDEGDNILVYNSSPKTESWEELFDKEFGYLFVKGEKRSLESFISSLIKDTEKRVAKEIVGEIKDMKMDSYNYDFEQGYNQAIGNILFKIKSKYNY